jgi:ABC-2 type transport system ATP-binding protein/ribosome-dependent ATPase
VTALLAETMDVVKQFGTRLAVDQVSVSVSPGEVVGLIGANGAGKTTLIRMLLGLIVPDRGRVRLHGQPPRRATRHRVGYVPQSLGLYEDLTVAENLSFTAKVYGVETPRLDETLAALGDTLIADLPLGARRRVAFIAALSHQPDLLVLDEPTSGVGPMGRASLWETIHAEADRGVGVLVTTHHMDEAEQCDRLVFLSGGREKFAGTVDRILEGQSTVEAVSADPALALTLLEQAGLPVLPAGERLRVPGSTVEDVRSVLGSEVVLVETPSTLEEAFMSLVSV